jgi:hypothetical protein
MATVLNKEQGLSGVPALLGIGGDAGRLIREFDWAATPLGPLANWTAPLKTTLAIILRSPLPIVTLWGEAAGQVSRTRH